MLLNLCGRPHLRLDDIAGEPVCLLISFRDVRLLIVMRIATIAEQNRDCTGAAGDFVFMDCASGNINSRRRKDLVNRAFEDDLTFKAGEIGMVADEIVELIRVVKMGYLVVGNFFRQLLRFMNRDIDVGIGM